MQVDSPPTTTAVILESLPDVPLADGDCSRRVRRRIDLMLLAIEALELSGSEALLSMVAELELQAVIPNRVALWRLRNTNPMRRRFNKRRPLTLPQAKALVLVGCYLARRLTVLIRQLLMAHQQLSDKGLSPEHHFRLNEYLERFRTHFRARMNPRRPAVAAHTDATLNDLALDLLGQLLLCTGTYGAQRFWISLFDGEVR